MGFDLHGRNKEGGDFSWNWAGWESLMQPDNCGKIIDITKFFDDGRYEYYSRDGKSPMCNDGFYVYAHECREMADRLAPAIVVQPERVKLLLFQKWLRQCRGFWIK